VTGPVFNGRSTLVFKDVPDGEYAIAVIHDENGIGKMDTNLLGIPREGVGVSNNVRGHFGSPGYDDSKFRLTMEPLNLNITIRYYYNTLPHVSKIPINCEGNTMTLDM